MKKFFIFIFFGLFLYSGEIKRDYLLSNKKAGNIEIGMEVDSLLKILDKNLIKLVNLNLEGFFSPAFEIYDREKKLSLVLEIDKFEGKWIVSRITVYDKNYKTKEGISLGSSLSDLKGNYKIDHIDTVEGYFYAIVEQLGMSFKFKPEEKEIISIIIY
ncbi:MAG: hypothetical protein WHV67_07130 [Thermoanaerobaculia bacterium]